MSGLYSLIAMRAGDPTLIDYVTNKGPTAGIYSGSGGAIVVVMAQEADATVTTTFAAVPAGIFMPIGIKKWVSGPVDALALFL